MVATVGSIQVAFRSDMAAYEAALRKGEKSTARFERRAKGNTEAVGQAFIRMGGLAKAAIGGLIAGIAAGGVTAIVRGFGDMAKSIAEVGDEARRAGVDVKSFQEWKFVAEQNRISVDALTDGLKELNLRADEFILTGKGSAAEAFARLGYGADDLKEKLKDPSALMLEIIGRLEKMDKAAQIRIADELFGGTAGERFVELLEQGEKGVRRTIDRAHELGAVMDKELIEKAAELDRRFNEVAASVGTTLKSAIVSAADSLIDFIERFRSFENQRSTTLDNRLAALGAERLEIETKILEAQANGALREAARNKAIGQYRIQLAGIAKEEAAILKALDGRVEPPKPIADREWTPPKVTSPEVERQAQAVRNLIAALEEELRLVGATDLQRDISNTLRQAGAAATEEQRAKVVALITALHAETEAQQQAADAAALYADIAKGVLSDLRGALSDGKLEWKELADVATSALDRLTDRKHDATLDVLFKEGEAQ